MEMVTSDGVSSGNQRHVVSKAFTYTESNAFVVVTCTHVSIQNIHLLFNRKSMSV